MSDNPFGEPEIQDLSGEIDPSLIAFLNEIKEKWPEIELQLENVSQWDEDLKSKLSSYIDDLSGEVKTMNVIRWLSVAAAGVVLIALLGILVCFLFYHQTFFKDNSYAGAALIIASISAMVFILRAGLIGAFSSVQDRHKGDMSPKSLVEAADHAKSFSEFGV